MSIMKHRELLEHCYLTYIIIDGTNRTTKDIRYFFFLRMLTEFTIEEEQNGYRTNGSSDQ